MVTVNETRQRTLDGPDAIAAYLADTYAAMAQESPFSAGEAVAIVKRTMVPPDLGVGDVALMLCDLPGQPWAWVLLLTASGVPVVVQVPTEALAKRDGAGK